MSRFDDLSHDELEKIKRMIENMDEIDAIDDDMRALVAALALAALEATAADEAMTSLPFRTLGFGKPLGQPRPFIEPLLTSFSARVVDHEPRRGSGCNLSC
jgi:hypothetical protein